MSAPYHKHGFTIVELLIVIVVIGILAAITIVAFNGIQQRANKVTLSSDLKNVATVFANAMATNGSLPTTMPTDIKVSPGNVFQATNTGSASSYCINGYKADGSLRMSWSSIKGTLVEGLCPGVTIGSAVGGIVPVTPRNVNVAPDFSQWTLSGGATYSSATGEITLGAGGSIRSPLIRLDSPSTISIDAAYYAATQSPYATFQPNAGHQSGVAYFASDGTTAVMNNSNYTSNGCARPFPVNVWTTATALCSYTGGPNIVYVVVNYTATGEYSSPDLKIKSPSVMAN